MWPFQISPCGTAPHGFLSAPETNRNGTTLAIDGFGNLYAGGNFTIAGTNSSYYIAKATLTGPLQNQMSLATAGSDTNVIEFLGIPGYSYALDIATNLVPPVNWIPQTTNMASTNNATMSGYVIVTNVGSCPQAFYRSRYVQP